MHKTIFPKAAPLALLCAVLLAGAATSHVAFADEKKPEMSPQATPAPFDRKAFGADPDYSDKPYDANQQIDIYGGKTIVDAPRPVVELGRPLYMTGPLPGGFNLLGQKNLVNPSFQVFGDWRNAVAYNDNGRGNQNAQAATRLNLEADLALTATERIHGLFRPFDQGGQFTRYEFSGGDRPRAKANLNGNPSDLFFEGDLGNILAGVTDKYQSFDLPFAVGLMPLVFQNGIWANDAITGAAFSIPARSSALLGISNMDISFFYGFDKVSTPAIANQGDLRADDNARVYGMSAFVDATGGYWEGGLGRVDASHSFSDQSYNSATLAFTRRYGGWLSNSLRVIDTFGQHRDNNRQQTADGVIFLMENSLITEKPLTLIPYMNLFAGFDRPQSLIRDPGAGGVLLNTGILFETDGLTGSPKLDDTGHNTFGGAIGVEYLFNLDQQIVLEAATVQVIGGELQPGRAARADQYGVGARYEIPLTKSVIFRADVIYGWREKDDNIMGVRSEIRLKF